MAAAEKLEQAENALAHSGRLGSFFMPPRKKEVCHAPNPTVFLFLFLQATHPFVLTRIFPGTSKNGSRTWLPDSTV